MCKMQIYIIPLLMIISSSDADNMIQSTEQAGSRGHNHQGSLPLNSCEVLASLGVIDPACTPKTTAVATGANAQLICIDDEFYVDPDQCDKYYHCIRGQYTEKLCPDGLIFDYTLGPRVEQCNYPFIVECPEGKVQRGWQCPSGEFVLSSLLCDGIDDCGDRADEDNCPDSCSGSAWQCPSGECIPTSSQCNGIDDCGDGADERSCTGCVFGDRVYPNKAMVQDTCMELQCIEGVWNYTGRIVKDCGECQVFGDPHIFTYDRQSSQSPPHYYPFMKPGIFTVTQGGLDTPAKYGLSALMEQCWLPYITCIRGINYFEPGLEINITLPSFDDNGGDCYPWNAGSPINIPGCAPKIEVDGQPRTFVKTMESFSATDGTVLLFPHNHHGIGWNTACDGANPGWWDCYVKLDGVQGNRVQKNLFCFNIVSSKGISMSFCMTPAGFYSNLYVWASPTLRGNLYGLCDTYTGGVRDGYTMQNGSLTYNDTDLFGSTWKTGENEHSGPPSPSVDKCENLTVLADIVAECKEITTYVCKIVSWWICEGFKFACVFDLCRSPNYNRQAQAYVNHFLIHSHLAHNVSTG